MGQEGADVDDFFWRRLRWQAGSNSSSSGTGSCSSSEGAVLAGCLQLLLDSRDGAGIFFMVRGSNNSGGDLGRTRVLLLIHSLREDWNSFQDYGSFREFPSLLFPGRDR
ncbi:hypothetical protein Zm00014a_000420 [Zea mays]|uniref:Uncharacterized protein n=1 Tax=Zea mays TaxID=4577 RepID=A0A3L6E054_MAIZE|nr:hypothetical protein Zm00014a_000420 [Zea mays]